MAKYKLKCLECGASYGETYYTQICERCNGLLEVIYAHISKPKRIGSFWDMKGVLPDSDYMELELGNTKLVKTGSNVYAKLEFENPTRSFKDRGSAVEVSRANDLGHSELVCASTGNMAYSVAYYSKIYGLKSRIFISRDANPDKLKNIKDTHNATIVKVNGDFTKAQSAAIDYSVKEGVFLAGDYCYRKEGQKTIAYELCYQLKGITDVIIPVGNATLFAGMYKGFLEIFGKGHGGIPRMIAVEAKGAASLVKAFRTRKPIRYELPKTKADAIAVGMPTFWHQAISGIKRSNGFAVAVSDIAMENAQKEIFMKNGLMVELGGAAAAAAYKTVKSRTGNKTAMILSGANI